VWTWYPGLVHRTPEVAWALGLMLVGCGRTGVWLPDDEPNAVRRCDGIDGTFATRVLAYDPSHGGFSPPEAASYRDPDAALGAPDYVRVRAEGAVALGQGGLLELSFDGCQLAPSGAGEPDLRIYEVGPLIERTTVWLRLTPAALAWGEVLGGDRDGWVELGIIEGSALDVDVDERLAPLDPDDVRFDALRLVDDAAEGGANPSSPGADVDAVELLAFDAP
jgi:hypothetical protein